MIQQAKHIKIFLIAFAIIAALFLTAGGVVYHQMKNDNFFGIRAIQMKTDHSGKQTILVNYLNITSYNVRVLNPGEQGDIDLDRNENLSEKVGAYRIEITVYDGEPTSSLLKKYPPFTVVPFEQSDDSSAGYKMMLGKPKDDMAYCIYIGSDQPISTEEQNVLLKSGCSIGSIKVSINQP